MEGSLRELLSDKERLELSIGLLREWWMTATQALVETAGSETALHHLRPHFINGGKAGAHVIFSITGIKDKIQNLEVMGKAMGYMMKGHFEVEIPDTAHHFIKRFEGCVTGGRSREVCLCMCNFNMCSMYNEMETTWDGTLTKSLSFGNECCEWTITRSNTNISDGKLQEYRNFYQNNLPSPIPQEIEEVLIHEYAGEGWTMATRAFIDYSFVRAMERLENCMRQSGRSFGTSLADHFDDSEVRIEVIGSIVGLVNDLHRRKWTMARGDGTLEGSVKECPFAHGALPEMCQQYCAFFNGVCEAIDPSYEFVYDRMMTKGDSTCHWVIRKKVSMVEGTKTTADSDVMKRLASRYVMGEISKQEYEELKAILK